MYCRPIAIGSEPLPGDLELIDPGPYLAAIVSTVDRSRLSDGDTVRLLMARDRLVSHLQAERAADIAEVAGRDDDNGEFAALEVGAALRLTGVAAKHELAFAVDVTARLPQIHEMLRAGRIDVRRARVIAEGTAHLPDVAACTVVADVAERAEDLTTGQLRSLVRKLCIIADPAADAARRGVAIEDRRLVVEATPAGTADLHLLDVSPEQAVAARSRIDHLARMLPNDGRTIEQRRADVAMDLLCGHGTSLGRGMVDITVDLATLLGMSEAPGELDGWGPVVAEMARHVVDSQIDGRWQATVIDDNGAPLAVALRRRPTASQARQVRARNRTCVFPGCRRPARRSDIDHTTRRADGGRTLERNLAPLCRSHHRAKDEGRWRYRRLPKGGHHWTSPLGRTYVTRGRSP